MKASRENTAAENELQNGQCLWNNKKRQVLWEDASERLFHDIGKKDGGTEQHLQWREAELEMQQRQVWEPGYGG